MDIESWKDDRQIFGQIDTIFKWTYPKIPKHKNYVNNKDIFFFFKNCILKM